MYIDWGKTNHINLIKSVLKITQLIKNMYSLLISSVMVVDGMMGIKGEIEIVHID